VVDGAVTFPQIKICGITCLEDGLAAVEAGANLLGFNFYSPSPRFITPQDCARLVARLPGEVVKVGVFVNASPAEVAAVLEDCGLDLAQLSGDEPPSDLEAIGVRAFKALRPADERAVEQALACYPPRPVPPAWLIDAFQPGRYGGTGQTADWSLAAGLAQRAPILLAGGLNPENAAQAVARVQPWGVDVASGVESAPGRKDPGKMAAFVAAARSGRAQESR
jgi:phosphoribosylanthranilate isomerase